MDNWPPRRYGWIATYEDGKQLREIYDQPPLTRWEEVVPECLVSLVLEDVWPTGEGQVLRLDCQTGVVHARGHALTFRVGDVRISEREGVYRDVLQYKQAHTDYRPGQGSTTQMDASYLGYRRELPELDAKILVRLNPRTRELGIEAELDLHRTLGRRVPGPCRRDAGGHPGRLPERGGRGGGGVSWPSRRSRPTRTPTSTKPAPGRPSGAAPACSSVARAG